MSSSLPLKLSQLCLVILHRVTQNACLSVRLYLIDLLYGCSPTPVLLFFLSLCSVRATTCKPPGTCTQALPWIPPPTTTHPSFAPGIRAICGLSAPSVRLAVLAKWARWVCIPEGARGVGFNFQDNLIKSFHLKSHLKSQILLVSLSQHWVLFSKPWHNFSDINLVSTLYCTLFI